MKDPLLPKALVIPQSLVTGAMKSRGVHWKTETEKPLDGSLHNELGRHAKQQMWDNKSTKEKVDEIISVKIHELVSVLDRESQLFSTSELKVKFEEQWKMWIKSLASQTPTMSKPHNIEFEIQEALKNHFKEQLPTLIKKLTLSEGGKSLQSWGWGLHLKIEEEHIKRPSIRSIVASGLAFGWLGKYEKWRRMAEAETDNYLRAVEKYLMSKQNKDYNPSFTTEMIVMLEREVRRFNSHNNIFFQFTLVYIIDLTLTACGYALGKFQQMAQRYRDENDPLKCLEREKPHYFNIFCEEYFQRAKEIQRFRRTS